LGQCPQPQNPKPQSPIPNPQNNNNSIILKDFYMIFLYLNI